MEVLVQKFGGTSVASYEKMKEVCKIIEAHKEKYKDIAKCDEDVLSLALFENVAIDFLNKKYNKVKEEDEVVEFNLLIG